MARRFYEHGKVLQAGTGSQLKKSGYRTALLMARFIKMTRYGSGSFKVLVRNGVISAKQRLNCWGLRLGKYLRKTCPSREGGAVKMKYPYEQRFIELIDEFVHMHGVMDEDDYDNVLQELEEEKQIWEETEK